MFMSVVSSAIKMGGVVLKKASGRRRNSICDYLGSGQFLNRHYTKGIFFLDRSNCLCNVLTFYI